MPSLLQSMRAGISGDRPEDPCLLAVGPLLLTTSLKSFSKESSQAKFYIVFTFSRSISVWKEERKTPPLLEVVKLRSREGKG